MIELAADGRWPGQGAAPPLLRGQELNSGRAGRVGPVRMARPDAILKDTSFTLTGAPTAMAPRFSIGSSLADLSDGFGKPIGGDLRSADIEAIQSAAETLSSAGSIT